jgi:hypothetical protein
MATVISYYCLILKNIGHTFTAIAILEWSLFFSTKIEEKKLVQILLLLFFVMNTSGHSRMAILVKVAIL